MRVHGDTFNKHRAIMQNAFYNNVYIYYAYIVVKAYLMNLIYM